MSINLEQLSILIESSENEHLEFKEAKSNFDFEELIRYCVALSNEGGGNLILGVTDKHPRKIIGSLAFPNMEKTKSAIYDHLHLKISVTEIEHFDGRVIVFEIPPRPPGLPLHYIGAYWMRSGSSLVPMTQDMLKNIFNETGLDFSSEICSDITIDDLSKDAIDIFRKKWHQKSMKKIILEYPIEQLLSDAELIIDNKITYSALILLGKQEAISKHLPQAEIVYEYRNSEAAGAAQQRIELKQAFLAIYDVVWNTIDLRNDLQHFHEGFFVHDIRTFNEKVIREAILNAVAHREYRLPGSIFIRQYPKRIEIISPGGFPAGVTEKNILWKQHPRNRRISESFAKCGLVERAGQGMNTIFEECIKESKPRPTFWGTDDYQVCLTLSGLIEDPNFIKFLEKIGSENLAQFSTLDFMLLDTIKREIELDKQLRDRIPRLIDLGIIEGLGHKKGRKYILSRKYYDFVGKKGI